MRHYPQLSTQVPSVLDVAQKAPSPVEIAKAMEIRDQFLFPGESTPWMMDIIRSMRLLNGAKKYVEIGTYDKGCLAYISSLLDPQATIVDVDIEARPEYTKKLSNFMQVGQELHTVVGDSTAQATIEDVQAALDGTKADAIFIDGNHCAAFAWADYAQYRRLVTPGGFLLFHDIFWSGTDDVLGVSYAMEWIDRLEPIYAVFQDHPVHLYFPWLEKGAEVWGGVGIVVVE